MKKILFIALLLIGSIGFGQKKEFSLVTKDSVTWNNSINTQKTSIIEGVLIEKYQKQGSGTTIIAFAYKDSDGNTFVQDKILLTDEEVNNLYHLVKDKMPKIETMTYTEYEWMLYYEGFRLKMAEKWKITPDKIELLTK